MPNARIRKKWIPKIPLLRIAPLLLALLLVACGELDFPWAAGTRSSYSAPPAGTSVNGDIGPVPQADRGKTDGRTIPADDPLIRYTGRFDFGDPKRPRFDWPAVMIEAMFEGSSVTALLDDGGNSYDVSVDGQTSILRTKPGQLRYVLAEGLNNGQHHVRLTKRTETFYGTPRFLGFELDAGRKLAPLPQESGRKIEFVGDSITAGYGVEGESPTCIFSPETENAALTYAAQTAAELDAAYAITAVSGVGVVRNYNSEGAMSAGTMLTYFGRTIANDDQENWIGNNWVPQAVVINLGTNDYSTTPHPAGEVFLRGYTNLIFKVRQHYPEAHIFAVAGPLMVGPAEDTIRSVVTQMNEVLVDERVYYVPIENTLELSAVDFGCDWHPNTHGQAKIAAQLIPAMKAVLDW